MKSDVVVIIGGGLTGLATGALLAKQGKRVTVLEKGNAARRPRLHATRRRASPSTTAPTPCTAGLRLARQVMARLGRAVPECGLPRRQRELLGRSATASPRSAQSRTSSSARSSSRSARKRHLRAPHPQVEGRRSRTACRRHDLGRVGRRSPTTRRPPLRSAPSARSTRTRARQRAQRARCSSTHLQREHVREGLRRLHARRLARRCTTPSSRTSEPTAARSSPAPASTSSRSATAASSPPSPAASATKRMRSSARCRRRTRRRSRRRAPRCTPSWRSGRRSRTCAPHCIDLGFSRIVRDDLDLVFDIERDLYYSIHQRAAPDLAPAGCQLMHAWPISRRSRPPTRRSLAAAQGAARRRTRPLLPRLADAVAVERTLPNVARARRAQDAGAIAATCVPLRSAVGGQPLLRRRRARPAVQPQRICLASAMEVADAITRDVRRQPGSRRGCRSGVNALGKSRASEHNYLVLSRAGRLHFASNAPVRCPRRGGCARIRTVFAPAPRGARGRRRAGQPASGDRCRSDERHAPVQSDRCSPPLPAADTYTSRSASMSPMPGPSAVGVSRRA